MPGRIASCIGRPQRIAEIGRIGEDSVKRRIAFVISHISSNNLNPVGPLRAGGITCGLGSGSSIYLYGSYPTRTSLCSHQRHQTCSGPYIQHTAPGAYIGPSAQQHAVGTHFHGTILLIYHETLESEPAV